MDRGTGACSSLQIVIVVLLALSASSSVLERGNRLSLAFMAADFQQLLAFRVLWREAILDVCLEQCVIWNAAFQQVMQMVLVESAQSFWRDPINVPATLLRDRCLQPAQFDPTDDFAPANVEDGGEGLQGEAVAANLPDAQMSSLKGAPKGFWAPVQLFGHFFDRVLRKQFPRFVQFLFFPAAVIDFCLDSVLDHESPAFLV